MIDLDGERAVPVAGGADPAAALRRLIEAATGADDLERLTRPLLDLVQQLTGQESAYLTAVDEAEGEQLVRFARNGGELQVEEGNRLDWAHSPCRRVLEGLAPEATDDTDSHFGDVVFVKLIGARSFMSVPVVTADRRLVGTLCAASRTPRPFDERSVELVRLLARLIADQAARERQRELPDGAGEQGPHHEQVAALERAKSEFLRLASHELRQPSMVLQGYLSLIGDGALGDVSVEVRDILPVLEAKVDEINRIADRMTETARLEDSRLELNVCDTDLRRVVSTAAAVIRPLAAARHRLVVDLPAAPVAVSVDTDRVETILVNLLGNAVKYSPDGGEVRCALRVDAEGARVAVSDEGVGIDPTDLGRLFTRFGRISTPQTQGVPGTGLGLYLARELARRHGGEVSVASHPGEGSTFTLTLPLSPGSGVG